MSEEPTVGILDPHVSLVEPSQAHRAEVDIPDSIIDLLEAYVLANAGDRDIDPLAVPADAAIGADVALLVVVRVFQRWQLAGQRSCGFGVSRGRRVTVC